MHFGIQWLLCTQPGEKRFREDPTAFGKAQWDVWSPNGWYTAEELAAAQDSWKGTDFQDVVLHSYRFRWGHADLDPMYRRPQAQFESTRTLNTRTLLLHGLADHCVLAETTDSAENYFTAGYRRITLDGVGHFPQRETPEVAAAAILEHLREHV